MLPSVTNLSIIEEDTVLTITPIINFGIPRAINITWLQDGQVLDDDDPRVTISSEGVLTLTSISISSEGVYTIVVSNVNGAANDSIQVELSERELA
jgi:hypothetical protein